MKRLGSKVCYLCESESSLSTSLKAEAKNVKSVFSVSSRKLEHAGLTQISGMLSLSKPVNHNP